MSPTRQKIGNPYLIGAKVAGGQTSVMGTRLSNGHFLAAWQDQGATIDSYDVRDRIFTLGGAGISADQRAHPERLGLQTPRAVAALAGGQSVIGYSSAVNGIVREKVTVLPLNGTLSAPPVFIKLAEADAQFGSAGVTGLGASRWTAGFYEKGTSDTARLKCRTFNGTAPAGPYRSLFDVRVGDDGAIDNPPNPPNLATVDPKPADRVFFNYYALTGAGLPSVQGRIFNVDTGAAVSAPVTIRASASGRHPKNEALIGLPSSGVFVSGFSEESGVLTASRAAVQRLLFNPGP